LDENPGNGCVRQRHGRCMLVSQCVTDRVPAEAGEVWQQWILISRTAGEKAFANADILRVCGGRRRSRWARLRDPEFAGDDVEVCCCPLSHPLTVRGRSSSSSRPRPAPPLSLTMDEKQDDDWTQSRKNRLPSFAEVLARRTRPPVDLFMF
jgi:hypothetical protein